ncbi:hypothetical protein [Leptospira interrogans]|nr:hypothetical protein [Leptospira interrogans]EMN54257.1 hypothetical protein LEP1GSC089_4446 [Leptospira interrogans serovar Autumnalis str. LP101]EMN80444.1 hypothetical protein LEP1GSC106_0831 [Leptospira interrogans serovar Grippotyphosa str. UI 12764]
MPNVTMSTDKNQIVDIGLVNIRKRYLDLAESIADSAKEGINYDDRILPVYSLLTSSVEVYSREILEFDRALDLDKDILFRADYDITPFYNRFREIIKIIRLGKFYPLEILKAFSSLMDIESQKSIENFESIWFDLRQIRNAIIHPSVLTYDIKIDRSEEIRNSLFNERNVIFIGEFYSDYPGKDKLQLLIRRGLMTNRKMGLDLYSYFSNREIARYFINKVSLFFKDYIQYFKEPVIRDALHKFLFLEEY